MTRVVSYGLMVDVECWGDLGKRFEMCPKAINFQDTWFSAAGSK